MCAGKAEVGRVNVKPLDVDAAGMAFALARGGAGDGDDTVVVVMMGVTGVVAGTAPNPGIMRRGGVGWVESAPPVICRAEEGGEGGEAGLVACAVVLAFAAASEAVPEVGDGTATATRDDGATWITMRRGV